MPLHDPPLNRSECPICRALVAVEEANAFCSECGMRFGEEPVEELRAVMYLLSELKRWQADGAITPVEAATLRQTYESRRDNLRARLASNPAQDRASLSHQEAQRAAPETARAEETQPSNETVVVNQPTAGIDADDGVAAAVAAPPLIRFPVLRPTPPHRQRQGAKEERRTLFETLAEPYTLRLLLYTGAAMFVVGVVIWLRDVLYLKLQEPLVQAALLMLGTITLTSAGWYTILRTRQRFTGRALTLTGSLLVPVNFWFLVRSGLIENRGRAWVVCLLCTLLYTHTAALLREKLYVYLACAASVATGWALVYRAEPGAPALYALVLLAAALIFIHLSRIFPASRARDEAAETAPAEHPEQSANSSWNANIIVGRWSRELWSTPLLYASLAGASLCAILYMPLRLGPSLSLYDGIFRLRAAQYDPSISILLFTGVAYTMWRAGTYVAAKRRTSFYTLGALALLWAEFLTLDGLRLSGRVQILVLAATALVVSLAARRARSTETARALYTAGVFVSVMLTPIALAVLLATEVLTFQHSAGFTLLAAAFVVLSAPRLCERAAQSTFAYAAAALASTAFIVALISLSPRSETLFTAACAAWPFVIYACAVLARRTQRETQLAVPFVRTASAEFVLLLLWASVVALVLYLSAPEPAVVERTALVCALCAPIIYGLLRAERDRSAFGAALSAIAAIILVASSLDAFEHAGVWPRRWPIAAGVVGAAFLLQKAGAWWFGSRNAPAENDKKSLVSTIRLVMDAAVMACAVLVFAKAFFLFLKPDGWSAACVFLLALVYWSERASQNHAAREVHLASTHGVAFFLALLIALGTDGQWFVPLFALLMVPILFIVSGYARTRQAAWLAVPVREAAVIAMGLAFVGGLSQAAPHLRAGDPLLLAPALTMATLALLSFILSLLMAVRGRVRAFRAGLYLTVIAYALLCLRSGFEPLADVEVYTSPVAIMLLVVAYLSFRRAWNDYERDTSLLFWAGSMLLAGPLLLRALEFRLLLDMPAPSRDLATLCASLALLLFGVIGRLRAPVIVGVFTLLMELVALALTSVDWLQVPLKIYLVTVGALLALVGWMFEYRREQLMLIRNRLNTHRETARERFGEWR